MNDSSLEMFRLQLNRGTLFPETCKEKLSSLCLILHTSAFVAAWRCLGKELTSYTVITRFTFMLWYKIRVFDIQKLYPSLSKIIS